MTIDELAVPLRAALAAARAAGWTDRELRHVGSRLRSKPGAPLLDQLLAGGDVRLWARSQRHRGPAESAALALLLALESLPPVPPPASRPPGGIDGGVLAKVRALLAKAESTTFAAEAEVLTAKAEELMARHAIDHALLAFGTAGDSAAGDSAAGDSAAGDGAITSARVLLAEPYLKARFSLLSAVASANRCKALLWQGLGIAVVFGHAADLEAVQLLHTSLSMQSAAALAAAERPEGARTKSGVAAYRRAFLFSFARRVEERLRASSAAAVAAAEEEHGPGVLPALAARGAAVEAAIAAWAPRLRSMRSQVSDPAGWAAGERAGSSATLGAHRLPARPRSLGRG